MFYLKNWFALGGRLIVGWYPDAFTVDIFILANLSIARLKLALKTREGYRALFCIGVRIKKSGGGVCGNFVV